MVIHVQEAFRTANRQSQKKYHIVVKTLNIQYKERILKATREKCQLTYDRFLDRKSKSTEGTE
jgi:hypothetical protein